MAGETVTTEAVCLDIRPWSQTSHVVTWLTPVGRLATVVKGAVRPKSAFLGQYDLNYTCEILYYARAHGDLHALRACAPLRLRENLRGDYRALALAGYFRSLAAELAPAGSECARWFALLDRALSELVPDLPTMLRYELAVLELSGLKPDFSGYDRDGAWSAFSLETGSFGGQGRCIRVSRDVAECLCELKKNEKNLRTPLDAARVIGVFYQFHLDCAFAVRRTILSMVANK